MRVSCRAFPAVLVVSLVALAGCAGSDGVTGGGDINVTEETTSSAESAATGTSASRTAFEVEPADGDCPRSAPGCRGFWLRRLNGGAWQYAAAMEVSSLFATDTELRSFVAAARERRAIVIGSIVIGSIVIGSRSSIVIGSRNGIVIGSRSIVIGSRDPVLSAAQAWVAPVPGTSSGTYFSVTASSSCSRTPCSSFWASALNGGFHGTRFDALTSRNADTAFAVNNAVLGRSLIVVGDKRSTTGGVALDIVQYFVPLRGSCESGQQYAQRYAQ